MMGKGNAQTAAGSSRSKDRTSPGQSAMEFLTTYGWAILVIIIILAMLFYLGIFNPKGKYANTCIFSPGHSCYTFKLGSGTGNIILDFGQATGNSIRVTGISCSANETYAGSNITSLANSITIGSGAHAWIVGGDSGNSYQCKDAFGSNVSGDSAALGERYKGRICVRYTELTSRETERVVCGDVTALFEPMGAAELGGGGSPTPTPGPLYFYSGSVRGIGLETEGAEGGMQFAPQAGYPYAALAGGTPIDGASVTMKRYEGNTYTDSSAGGGLFSLEVPAGWYTLRITKTGYDELFTDKWFEVSGEISDQTWYIYETHPTGGPPGTDCSMNGGIDCDSFECWSSKLYNYYCVPESSAQVSQISWACGSTGECNDEMEWGMVCDPTTHLCAEEAPESYATPTPAPTPYEAIASCGTTISTPGYYYIDEENLPMAGTGACITITTGASGSTLDCKGHSITGDGSKNGYGILLNWDGYSHVSGVTVKNCHVHNLYVGIYLSRADYCVISGNDASDNDYGPSDGYGMVIDYSYNNQITGNTVKDNNGWGIAMRYASSGNTLTGNTITDSAQWDAACVGGSTTLDGGSNVCNSENCNVLSCTAPPPKANGESCTSESQCTSSYCYWNTKWDHKYCCDNSDWTYPPCCSPGGGDDDCSDWGLVCSGSPSYKCVSAPPTAITECGTVITDSKSYVLDTNLTATGGQTCITFTSGSGATLDCQNNDITGAGSGIGILFDGTGYARASNCHISGFSTGIRFTGGPYMGRANYNTITGGTRGIEFISSMYNDVQGNTVSGASEADFYCDAESSYQYDGGDNACATQSGCGWLTSCPCDHNDTCDPGETCACSDCEGEQDGCEAGFVCGVEGCMPKCDSDAVCDPDEGCYCSDCNGQQDGCEAGYVCSDGSCIPACEVGGVVVSCPCTLNTLGSYRLDSSLPAYHGICITVQSGGAGSSIDCQNNQITGTASGGDYGILVDSANSVTVQNCAISSEDIGIYIASSSNGNYNHNTITPGGPNARGINLNAAHYNTIDHNTVTGGQIGICLDGGYGACNNNIISNNNVGGTTYSGIFTHASYDNALTGNTAVGGSVGDFYCGGGATFTDTTGNKCNNPDSCPFTCAPP